MQERFLFEHWRLFSVAPSVAGCAPACVKVQGKHGGHGCRGMQPVFLPGGSRAPVGHSRTINRNLAVALALQSMRVLLLLQRFLPHR